MQALTFLMQDWRRPFWFTLLIASSFAFTFAFACAMPLAAFGAIAALTLVKRDAYYLTVGVWLANQMVGFMFLNYPLSADCFEWGAALGVTGLLCTLGAWQTLSHLRINRWLSGAAAFLAAFAVYEATLYAFALVLGGTEIFTFAIQGRIFAINCGAMFGLLLLSWVGMALQISPAYRPANRLIQA